MAVAEPPGDFDYLLDDLADTDDENFGSDDDGFDDEYGVDPYQPPLPWYRTTRALVAIGAIATAVIAILVSAVLLVSRNSRGTSDNVETTIAPTPSSASVPAATTPPMVPPSPTESPSEPSASAPVVVAPPPGRSEPTRPPEIGVTRTPVTRMPISVRPPPVPHF